MATSHAQRIERYLAAHPGATLREARGHGATGEHGVTVRALGQNQVAVTFHDEKQATKAARAAERVAGDGGRVKLVAIDKSGNVKELFANRGHIAGMTAEELRDRVQREGIARVVEAALNGQYNHGKKQEPPEDAGGFDPPHIREYQLIVQ